MSEDERHTGTLQRLPYEGDELEEFSRSLLIKNQEIEADFDIKNDEWHDTYLSLLLDSEISYEKYFMYDGHLYEILDDEVIEDYTTYLHKNDNGTISYDTHFYNGCMCLTESIKMGLQEVDDAKKYQ